jgi:hypothetical protein
MEFVFAFIPRIFVSTALSIASDTRPTDSHAALLNRYKTIGTLIISPLIRTQRITTALAGFMREIRPPIKEEI